MSDSPWTTAVLIALAAIILIVTGIKKKAQLGILLVIALIVISHRLGLTSFAQMGFVPPENWLKTVLLGFLIGSVLPLLFIIVIQPLFEHLTGQPHDVSIVKEAQGGWKGLLNWLIIIWTVVAFGEEILFRGFLMSQIVKLLGIDLPALVLNVLLSATVFGFAHSYQGHSGTWSTGIMGACLGICYILSGFNLWLPILVHGMGNTVELVLMSRGVDKPLRELIWKRPQLTQA